MDFTSQDTPLWYWNYGLEATFLLFLTWPLAISSPPQSFLPVGIEGRRHQRLILATPSAPYTGTPSTGDASSWRRLFFLATPHPPSSGPSMGPTVSLTLTLVNARGRDGTIMLPSKQTSNKCIQILIISGIVEMTSFQFFTKISYGVALLKENNPNAYI